MKCDLGSSGRPYLGNDLKEGTALYKEGISSAMNGSVVLGQLCFDSVSVYGVCGTEEK